MDFVSNNKEAILRVNELYIEDAALQYNGGSLEMYKLCEMKFLIFILTGQHA